jgi:membrane protease YdiL (CAAX protease family)
MLAATFMFLLVILLTGLVFSAFPHLATSLSQTTGGLVSNVLCTSVILLGCEALLLGVIFRLRASDVGLIWRRAYGGVAVYMAAWLCYQVIFTLLALVSPGHVSLEPYWRQPAQYPAIAGVFLTYSTGVALCEETLFRGFLVLQVWQRLSGRLDPWRRLAFTLAISQGIFAIVHVPAILTEGDMPGVALLRLGSIFLAGVLFALVWLKTGNLFIAVAVHGLADGAIPLIHQTAVNDSSYLAWGVVLVILVLWPMFAGHSGLVAALAPVERGAGVPMNAS